MSGDAPLHPFILVRNLDFELGKIRGRQERLRMAISIG
jgi:hypothetical protein